ncbi:hypothetical protein EJ73_01828 [Hoylesella shahii DSM 15611 = JCM 12083]|uniref:Uncharacterized protein n=1 Tax=Hoylesella shahii DSM 15611 = JCM 12083 TaxID=1122991 RepID=A0A318HRZ7_9BACT|nr:hypothetical protein EJ73_01828 [Hoylesella shahii DSM 15611 = JCM 12083]
MVASHVKAVTAIFTQPLYRLNARAEYLTQIDHYTTMFLDFLYLGCYIHSNSLNSHQSRFDF